MRASIVKVDICFECAARVDELWQRIAEATYFIYFAYEGRTLNLVLLPDRMAFLLEVEVENLGAILSYLIELLFAEVRIYSHSLRTIENLGELYLEYRRIYRKPVKLCLATRAELYPYSSLAVLLSPDGVNLLVCDPIAFQDENSREVLDWLNQELSSG